MNNIGIFICNYNGKEWVMKCIESLFEQSMQQFDIYVADNASTDGTAESVSEKYGEMVSILRNAENMGGAGGFDRGLRTGLEKGYQYIVLLDNDIVLDKAAIENMKCFLESHDDFGIVGAKVMIMDKPDMIQDYGNRLDFHKFREVNEYKWEKDSENLPLINECDYVPTCAVMVRAKMLKVSGTMPAENFIYYDDIELSYKMKLHGYKVAALGNVKVWHKGGFRKANINTFPRYYFLRNRLHFFAKYIPEEDIERFADTTLPEVFSQLYGFYNKGMIESFRTTVYAFDDFLHGIRGKADDFKIMRIVERHTPFENAVIGKEHIRIIFINNFHPQDSLDIFHIFLYIVGNIQKINPQRKLWVSLKQCDYKEAEFKDLLKKTIETDNPEIQPPEIIVSDDDADMFDLELKMCEHVRLINEPALPQIYVDRYCNCITSDSDYEYIKSYAVNERLFMETYRPLAIRAVKNIREKAVEN